jgi:hypothetical protein
MSESAIIPARGSALRRRSSRKALFFGLFVILTSSVLFVLAPWQPSFQGKSRKAWVRALSDRENRAAALEALRNAGPLATHFLLEGLKTRDFQGYNEVCAKLPIFLRQRLPRSDLSQFRSDCAKLLGEVRPLSPEVITALLRAVRSRDFATRYGAAWALRRIAQDDENVASHLKTNFPSLMEIEIAERSEALSIMNALRSITD